MDEFESGLSQSAELTAQAIGDARLSSIIARVFETRTASGSEVDCHEITQEILQQHPAAVTMETARLVRDSVHRKVTQHARRIGALSDDDEPQMSIPGIDELPRYITYLGGDGKSLKVKLTENATIPQLERSLVLKQANVDRCLRRADKTKALIDFLTYHQCETLLHWQQQNGQAA